MRTFVARSHSQHAAGNLIRPDPYGARGLRGEELERGQKCAENYHKTAQDC